MPIAQLEEVTALNGSTERRYGRESDGTGHDRHSGPKVNSEENGEQIFGDVDEIGVLYVNPVQESDLTRKGIYVRH